MSAYSESLQVHLANYKREQLGVLADGLWRHNRKAYPHILPEAQYQLNILPRIRDEFWAYAAHAGIHRHTDFHHLTSSQAFAFNIFFPFRLAGAAAAKGLASALALTDALVTDVRFEVVLDDDEETNFDVVIDHTHGQVLIEVKLTEPHFGAGRPDRAHRHKRGALYARRLEGKVAASALTDAVFWSYYQLLRNISYASPALGRHVVLLMPSANEGLRADTARFLSGFLTAEFRPWVRLVFSEDLVAALQASIPEPPWLREHLRDLRIKYFADAAV